MRLALICIAFMIGFPSSIWAEEKTFIGLEIGAKGVKAVQVTAECTKGVVKFKSAPKDVSDLIDKTTINTSLGNIEIREGKKSFAENNLKRTGVAVGRLLTAIKDSLNGQPVSGCFIVASSGLPADATNWKELEKIVAEETKHVFEEALPLLRLTVEMEIGFEILGTLPGSQADDAILIDFGSGNFKFGALILIQGLRGERWLDATRTDNLPGSKFFLEGIKKRLAKDPKLTFAEAARQEWDQTTHKVVDAEANNISMLRNSRSVYLSGGVVWAAATLLYPAAVEQEFVQLNVEDLQKLAKELAANPSVFPAQRPLSPQEKARYGAAAEEEFKRVRGVFTAEQFAAGVQQIAMIAGKDGFALDTKPEGQPRSIYFARPAQYGWILAYVRKQVEKEVDKAKK